MEIGGGIGTLLAVFRFIIALTLVATGCSAGAAVEVTSTSPPSATTSTPAETPAPAAATTSTTTKSTTTTTLPVEPVVLAFGGDVSFTHGLWATDPLGRISGLLNAADQAWINLETAIAEEGVGVPFDKKYVFRSPPVTAEMLGAAGVTGVALGNNHTLDFGVAGLERTIELLEESGVSHAGAGSNRSEAYSPAVFELESTSVAFLSFSRVLSAPVWAATDDRPGLASAYDPFVARSNEAVVEAARMAEVVVVMVHWGIERSACPEDYQRDLAAGWASAGADLVVGSHPHVLQGVEQIGDTWVIYSTGNLAFPSANSDDATKTVLFEATIHDGEIRVGVEPLRIVAGAPAPASVEDRAAILETLNSRSLGVSFDSDGGAVTGEPGSACG
ncbi:MAG: CapA family protein [Acidimicrobiia bacterium]|nr:CapA family protein [Acidimicrobiia bacterium]